MLRVHSRFIVATLLFVAFLAVFFAGDLYGWSKDYKMTITVTTDKNDELVEIFMLTEREMRDLKEDPRNSIKPYLIDIRKKYADEIGYRHEIYGKNNYKMVVIVRYKFDIRDKSSGRIVVKK